jgi:tRNA nucleotidyltransferase (CCA-adding enzyme)
MAFDSLPERSAFGQTHPGLAVLRMASLLAETDETPGDDMLALLTEQVRAGVLADAAPAAIWPELVLALTGKAPQKALRIASDCGALEQILPEVEALFGVPQISEGQAEVDLGEHLLKALERAAAENAPLPVRFALLVMNVGKSDSPPEHLPVHYKHIERGRPRIEAIAKRFGAPAQCLDLALLALAECERVHRVTQVRAGPVAAMLERLDAFGRPERFRQLLTVCACDFGAHGAGSTRTYPKAALLNAALAACATLEEPTSVEARAEAIALAFRSQRWSDQLA